MNFLAMCQRLGREAGIPGGGPASVVSQTGLQQKVVEWIQEADEDIQRRYADWKFLRTDFDFSTVASQQAYTPDQASVSDLNKWIASEYGDVSCRLTDSDEQYIHFLEWSDFKFRYLKGSLRSTTGRPQYFSIKPDKSIIFYPTPDAAYQITGEYYRKAQQMTANADKPLYPEEYHMTAVWRALMLYGAYEAADERYSHGQNEFNRLFAALKRDQMPEIVWETTLV